VPGRAIVLPYAVGPNGPEAEFHVSKSDGCSSLLKIERDKLRMPEKMRMWRDFWATKCAHANGAPRHVPLVSLHKVLHEWLPGRRIDHVKIDAQGFDLQVAMSAGDSIKRVRTLEIELTGNAMSLPYVGAASCGDTLGNLTKLGFEAPPSLNPGGGIDCAANGHRSAFFTRSSRKKEGQ